MTKNFTTNRHEKTRKRGRIYHGATRREELGVRNGVAVRKHCVLHAPLTNFTF